jgi:hypothetical protein
MTEPEIFSMIEEQICICLGDSACSSLLYGIKLISPWKETFLEASSHSATAELPSRL